MPGSEARERRAADSPCPPPSGRQLCVSVTHTPFEVSAATAAGQTFVSFTATLQNVGKSELTHTTVTACLASGSGGSECGAAPPGTSFYSADASAGSCTINGATARCVIGKLRKGALATVELVSRAPTQAAAFRNVVSVTVKERGSDSPQPDPQADTITVSEPVTTLAAGGPRATSFVPDGIATQLLAADEGQSGLSKIPSAHDGLTAELAITDDPPFVCPKYEICRSGGWVSATIPGTFDSLQFVLHWPDEFVSAKQTREELRALLSRLRHLRARDHPRPVQLGDTFRRRAALPLEHSRPGTRRVSRRRSSPPTTGRCTSRPAW